MIGKNIYTPFIAVLVVGLLIGNSFVAIAGIPAPPPVAPGSTTYVDGDWVVNNTVEYVNQTIVLTGNLTVLAGCSLTLTNTTLVMNGSANPIQYTIEVLGTMILRDGGDGISPNGPGDSDASVITAFDPNYRPHLIIRDGATFDAKNSTIEYIGEDPSGNPGQVIGGDLPETDMSVWNNIRDGSFRITIEGISSDISGLNFTTDTIPGDVALRIENAIQAVGVGGFTAATCTWTGTEFLIRSGTDVDVLNVHESSVAVLEAHSGSIGTDISGITDSQQAKLSGGFARENNLARWNAVTDGTFNITIDGIARDIGPLNFATAGNLNDVALIIENAMQAMDGSFYNAGCEWTGANFVFTSGATGFSTTISNLSAHSLGIGTDISGLETSIGASMWGGVNPENNIVYWNTITNGEFGISINGDFQNIGPIDFTGLADMYAVADKIEFALQQIATGGYSQATCTWNSVRFTITAGAGTTVGSITPCVPTGTGTDISGAVGSSHTAYMDCGIAGTTNMTQWKNITNGTFGISIDGVAQNVGPINFSYATTINDVATNITTALVAAGFTGAVCAWTGGNNFRISSSTESLITNVSALTAGTSGQDISNASWMNGLIGIETVTFTKYWMDCNAGVTLASPYWWLDCAGNATYSMTPQAWWLDCAANATEDPMFTEYLGIYSLSDNVSFDNCLITDCKNALLFDSSSPALLQNTRVVDSDGFGLLIFNLTDPAFSMPNLVITDTEITGHSNYGVLIMADAVGIEASGMDISNNDYGLIIEAGTSVDAHFEDMEIITNNGEGVLIEADIIDIVASEMDVSNNDCGLMLIGGTDVTATLEDIDAINNNNHGIEVSSGGNAELVSVDAVINSNSLAGISITALNTVTIDLYNNDLSSNGWHGIYVESADLNAFIEMCDISSNNDDGMEVQSTGTVNFNMAYTDLDDEGDLALDINGEDIVADVGGISIDGGEYGICFYANNSLEADIHDSSITDLNGCPDYNSNYPDASSIFLWASETGSIDARIERNYVMDNNCGGIKVGWQYDGVASNDTTVEVAMNVFVDNHYGHVFQARNNLDVKFTDNQILPYDPVDGDVIEYSQADVIRIGCNYDDETVLSNIFCNNLTLDMSRNSFNRVDPSLGIDGWVKTAARYNMDVTMLDNTVSVIDSPAIEGIFWIGHPNTDEWDWTLPEFPVVHTLTALIDGNTIDTTNTAWRSGFSIIAEETMNVIFTNNDLIKRGDGSYGALRLGFHHEDDMAVKNCTAIVKGNNFIIPPNAYGSDGGGYLMASASENLNIDLVENHLEFNDAIESCSGAGNFILLGPIDNGDEWETQNVTANILGNTMVVNIYGQGSIGGGVIKAVGYYNTHLNIKNNNIQVRHLGDLSQCAGIPAIMKLGMMSGDYIVSRELIANISGNHIEGYLGGGTDISGSIRATARDNCVVDMYDNVIKCTWDIPSTAPHLLYSKNFGVRIGYVCSWEGIIAKSTTVRMGNNVFGPNSLTSVVSLGAIEQLTVDSYNDVISGGVYSDHCYVFDTYGIEHTWGNGLTLLGGNITANIINAQLMDNQGAGIYIETPNAANINILNSDITGNDWGGIMLNGHDGAEISGLIENCNLVGNGMDTWETFDSTFGIEFHHATMMIRNSSLANPDATLEMRIMDDSHVTSLNTYFNKDRAKILGTPATLTSGSAYEFYESNLGCWIPANKWQTLSNGAFRITIDGFSADIGPIDFNGVGWDINNVAQRIEDAIRAVPGAPDGFKNATVDYTNDAGFRITSGTIGPNSNITRLETHSGGIGTDISGNTVSTKPYIVSGSNHARNCRWDYGRWTVLSNGTFRLTIGNFTADVGPINFVGAASRDVVLARIQDAIRAVPGAPESFTLARVYYSYSYLVGYRTFYIFSGTDEIVYPLETHSWGNGSDISGNALDPWGTTWLDMAANATQHATASYWLDMAGTTSTVVNGTVGTADLLVQWYLDAKVVRDDNGLAIPDANVTIRDSSNAVIGTGATGLDGWFRGTIANEYLQTSTTKTFYTPHTVSATKVLATGTASPNMDMSKNVIISLDYTPAMPVADAGMNISVLTGFDAIFNGTNSTGEPPLSYMWTFNNSVANITLNGAVAAFNCTVPAITPGMYNVTLTVTDYWGNQANDTLVLTVIDSNSPVADAGPDQAVNEDTTVTFNGSASSDPVGVTNYTWTFVDVTAKTLYGVAPTYIFTQPGVYLVTLNVLDGEGNNGTDNLTVTVKDITEPIANAGPDQTIPEGGQAQFTAVASTDNVEIVSYEWTFTEGSNIVKLFGMTPTYSFLTLGSYVVTLTTFDAEENSATDIMWVHVVDVTPPAVLVIAPGDSLTEVSLNWSLVIVFTEPMNRTSVEEAFNFSGPQNAIFTWDATGRYVQVSFEGGLVENTTYSFSIGSAAKDVRGNPITATYTGSFKTMATPAIPEVPEEPEEPEEPEPEEPETNFFTNNWWILVVIIVVLAILLVISLLRGGKGGTAPAEDEDDPPEPAAAEEAPAPEPAPAEPVPETTAEEEIQ